MTANSQLLTTDLKQKQKQSKQTTRTGTESQKWRSYGGYQGGGRGGNGGKGTGNKQHKWQVENRQGKVKNSTGNVETKSGLYTHGYELRCGGRE